MADQPLDPYLQRLADEAAAWGQLPLSRIGLAEARKRVRAGHQLCQTGPALEAVDDLAAPTSSGEVEVRIYHAEPAGTRRTLVYAHGGSSTTGDLECADELCRILCRDAGCTWPVSTTGLPQSTRIRSRWTTSMTPCAGRPRTLRATACSPWSATAPPATWPPRLRSGPVTASPRWTCRCSSTRCSTTTWTGRRPAAPLPHRPGRHGRRPRAGPATARRAGGLLGPAGRPYRAATGPPPGRRAQPAARRGPRLHRAAGRRRVPVTRSHPTLAHCFLRFTGGGPGGAGRAGPTGPRCRGPVLRDRGPTRTSSAVRRRLTMHMICQTTPGTEHRSLRGPK